MKKNFQKKLEDIIKVNQDNGRVPSLLLHSCCAPCSSYCIEYLSRYFDITLYFYNPNISYKEEFEKRANELIRLVNSMHLEREVKIVIEHYDASEFYNIAKGLEKEPERGKRCVKCFELRLDKAGSYAKAHNFDYFTTTLSISPHKDAALLNEIGESFSSIYDVDYLYSDFKKKNGYKRSIELSSEYNLYRQDYCGCIYSKQQREQESKLKSNTNL